MTTVLDQILSAFSDRGDERYGEEQVTQLQHALQAASLAQAAGASAELTTAALLHDIGHILSRPDMPADCHHGLDDHHETRGYQFLSRHFRPAVADPVRLHVVAKRYLCTTRGEYLAQLSPTSRQSFHDQGGVLPEEERRQFEAEPYFSQSLQLRIWDDMAKDTAAPTPPLSAFVKCVEESLRNASSRNAQ